LGASSQRK